ncbi:VOC family protein [Nocardia sp.]|uniref:VOC family protein n=1 Tax=Nocardia sp. TaxID=1821 RepID=UPI00263427FF|nr:VOC family protein [Nocardia sp.]
MNPGQVVWFEIATDAATPVQKFYTELLNWTYELDPDSSIDGRRYIRIIAPGAPFPMGAIQEAAGTPTGSRLSILSADVRADVDRLSKLGATVQVRATQVSDVTWFAVLTDPLGNPFSLFSRSESERFSERMEHGEQAITESMFQPQPGWMGGFELATTDPGTTREFYSRAFGWTFADAGPGRQLICTGTDWPSGTLYDHSGGTLDYLIPLFLTENATALAAVAETLGGTVESDASTPNDGTASARVRDPQGLRFVVRSDVGN